MADTTNVVSLAAVREALRPYYLLSTLIDANARLREGDLVAFCWAHDDGSNGVVLFARWLGPTGRGAHGRFVRKGSPQEHFQLDCGMVYCADDLRCGRLSILGKVYGSRLSHKFHRAMTDCP